MIDVSYVLWMELHNKLHDEVPSNQSVALACLAYRMLFLQPGFTEHELSLLGISAQQGDVRVTTHTCPTIFSILQRSVKYSLVKRAIEEYFRVVCLRESASNARWARPCTLAALRGTGHTAWTRAAFEGAWQLGEHAPGGPFLYGFVADYSAGSSSSSTSASTSRRVIMDSDPFAHLAKRNPVWQTDHTSLLKTRETVTAVTSVQFQPVLLHLVSALHQVCLAIQDLGGFTEGGLGQVSAERTQEQARAYKDEVRNNMHNGLNKARALRALMWAWMPPESSSPSTAAYAERCSRFSSALRCRVDPRSGAATAFSQPWSPEEAASFCLSLQQVRELTAEYISAMGGVGSADLASVPVFLWADCSDRYTPVVTRPPSSSSPSSSSTKSSPAPPAAVSSELCMLRERDELVLYARMASQGSFQALVSQDGSVRVHVHEEGTVDSAGAKSGGAAGSAAGKRCDLPVELNSALTRDFVQRSHDAVLAAERAFRQERQLRLLPKPYALGFRVPALKPHKDTSVWSCLSPLYDKDTKLRKELMEKKVRTSPPPDHPGSVPATPCLAGSHPVSSSPPYSAPSPPYIPAAAGIVVAAAAAVARGGLQSTAAAHSSESSPLSVQADPAAAAASVKPVVQSSSLAPAATESIPNLGPPLLPTQEEKDATALKAANRALTSNKELASAKQALDTAVNTVRQTLAVAGYGTLTVEEMVPLSPTLAAQADAYARLVATVKEAAKKAAVDHLVATRAHLRRVFEQHVAELTSTHGSLFAVAQLPWVQDVVRWLRAQPPGIKALPNSYPSLTAEQKKLVQRWVAYQMWDWMVQQVPLPPPPSLSFGLSSVPGAAANATPAVQPTVARSTGGPGAQTQAASSTSIGGQQQGVIVPAGAFAFTPQGVVKLPAPPSAGGAEQASSGGKGAGGTRGKQGEQGTGSNAGGSKEQAGNLPDLVYTPPSVHSSATGDTRTSAATAGLPGWGSSTSVSAGTGSGTAQGQGQGRSQLSYAAPALVPAPAVSRASSAQAVGASADGADTARVPSAAEVQEARTLLPGAIEYERAALDVLKERTAGRLSGSVPQARETHAKAAERVKELLRTILLHTSAGIPTQTGAGASAEVAPIMTAPSTKGLSREQIDGVHPMADWEKQAIARSAVADAHKQVGEALAAQRAARRLLDNPAFASTKANKKSVRKTMRAEMGKEAAFRAVIESNGESAVKKAMKAREQLKQKAEVYLARHGGYQRLAAQHWIEPAVLWAYAAGHTAYWQYPGLTAEELGEAVQWAAYGMWPRILAMAPSKILNSIGNHCILMGLRAAGMQVELRWQEGDAHPDLWRPTEDMSRPQSPRTLFKHGAISASELRAYNEAAHEAALYQAAVRERLEWYSNSLSSDSTPFGESSAVLARQDNPACEVTAWDLYSSLAPSEAMIAKTKDDDGRTALIKRHPPLTFSFQDGGSHPEPEFVWIATAILGERPTAFVMDTVGPVTQNASLQDAEQALVQQLPVTVATESSLATCANASSADTAASMQRLVPVYWYQVPIPDYQKIRQHVDNVRDAMDKSDASKSAFQDVLIAHGPAVTGMSQSQVIHLRVWDPEVRENLLARFPFLASVEVQRKKAQGVFQTAVQLLLVQLRASVALVFSRKEKDALSGLTKSEKKAAKAEMQRWPPANAVAKRMQIRLRYILDYHFDTHRLCRLIEAIYNNGKAAQGLSKSKAKAAWRAPGAALAAASCTASTTRWGALPSPSGNVVSLGHSGSGASYAYEASGHGVQGSAGGSGGWKSSGAHSAGEAGMGGAGGRGSGAGAGGGSRGGSGAGAGAGGQGHESDSEDEDERQRHGRSLYGESESEVEAVSDDNDEMDEEEEEEEGEDNGSLAEALGEEADEEGGNGLHLDQDGADVLASEAALQAELETARLAKLAVLKAKLLGSMRSASTSGTGGSTGGGGKDQTAAMPSPDTAGGLASAALSYPYTAPDGTRLHVVRGSPSLATSPEPLVEMGQDAEEGEERELAHPGQADGTTALLHAVAADGVPAAASAFGLPGVDQQQQGQQWVRQQQEEGEIEVPPAQGTQEEGEEGEVSKAEAQSIVEQALEREKTLREIRLKALRAKAALAKQQQQAQAQVSTPTGGGTSLLGPGGPPPPPVPATVPFAAQTGQVPPLPAFGSWGAGAPSAPVVGSVAGLSAGAGLLPLPFSMAPSLAVPPPTAAVAPIPPSLYVGQPFPTPYGPSYSAAPVPTSFPAPSSDQVPGLGPGPGPVGGPGAGLALQEDAADPASHMDVAASFMAHMLAKSVSAGAGAAANEAKDREDAAEETPPGMETPATASAAMEAQNVARAGTKRPAAAISPASLPSAATSAAASSTASAATTAAAAARAQGSKKAKLAAPPPITAKPSPLSSVATVKGAQSTPAALSAPGAGAGSKAVGGVGGSPSEPALAAQPPLSTAAAMHNETMNKKLRLFIAKLRGSAAAADLRKRYFSGLTPVPVTPMPPAAPGSSTGAGAAEAASMPISQATIAANSAAARRRAAAAAAIIRGEVPLTAYTQPPVLSTAHVHSLLHHAAAPSATAEEGQGALEATFSRCLAAVKAERAAAAVSAVPPTHDEQPLSKDGAGRTTTQGAVAASPGPGSAAAASPGARRSSRLRTSLRESQQSDAPSSARVSHALGGMAPGVQQETQQAPLGASPATKGGKKRARSIAGEERGIHVDAGLPSALVVPLPSLPDYVPTDAATATSSSLLGAQIHTLAALQSVVANSAGTVEPASGSVRGSGMLQNGLSAAWKEGRQVQQEQGQEVLQREAGLYTETARVTRKRAGAANAQACALEEQVTRVDATIADVRQAVASLGQEAKRRKGEATGIEAASRRAAR